MDRAWNHVQDANAKRLAQKINFEVPRGHETNKSLAAAHKQKAALKQMKNNTLANTAKNNRQKAAVAVGRGPPDTEAPKLSIVFRLRVQRLGVEKAATEVSLSLGQL